MVCGWVGAGKGRSSWQNSEIWDRTTATGWVNGSDERREYPYPRQY